MRNRHLPLAPGGSVNLRIKTLHACLCVCVPYVGPYSALGPVFGRLSKWAEANRSGRPQDRLIGLSDDDPGTVAPAALRYDVCLNTADQDADLPEGFRYEHIGGGRWAIHTLRSPYSLKPGEFRRLRGVWLPASGEQRDDRPFMENYLNDPTEVTDTDLLTDLCISCQEP